MKTTVTIPITRQGVERELSVTRDGDDELLEVFLPPAARTASAVFTLTAEDLARLAVAFSPPPPPVTFPGAVIDLLPGQTSILDLCHCTADVLDLGCPLHASTPDANGRRSL